MTPSFFTLLPDGMDMLRSCENAAEGFHEDTMESEKIYARATVRISSSEAVHIVNEHADALVQMGASTPPNDETGEKPPHAAEQSTP